MQVKIKTCKATMWMVGFWHGSFYLISCLKSGNLSCHEIERESF